MVAAAEQQQQYNLADTAYLWASALFFAACAWAQTNDPDPFWWIMGYLTGGCLFNGATALYLFDKKQKQQQQWILRAAVHVFLLGNATILVYWMMDFVPRLLELQHTQTHDHRSWQDFLWHGMEFEEGREIAGLLILWLHVWKVRQMIRLQQMKTTATTITKDGSALARNGTGMSSSYSTLVGVALLAVCTYIWIHYQPQMNQRDAVQHCSGAFQGFPSLFHQQ